MAMYIYIPLYVFTKYQFTALVESCMITGFMHALSFECSSYISLKPFATGALAQTPTMELKTTADPLIADRIAVLY